MCCTRLSKVSSKKRNARVSCVSGCVGRAEGVSVGLSSREPPHPPPLHTHIHTSRSFCYASAVSLTHLLANQLAATREERSDGGSHAVDSDSLQGWALAYVCMGLCFPMQEYVIFRDSCLFLVLELDRATVATACICLVTMLNFHDTSNEIL